MLTLLSTILANRLPQGGVENRRFIRREEPMRLCKHNSKTRPQAKPFLEKKA